jgi:DNA-binding NarL/FixJ family response regulator
MNTKSGSVEDRTTEQRRRVLIGDDHTLITELLRRLIEPEFEVVGVVQDGKALVKAALELKPDLVIVDISMPVMNGIDAGEQIKKVLPSTRLVFLTMNLSADVAAEALRRGASAYVVKVEAASALVQALRSAMQDRTYVSPKIAREVEFELSHARKEELPPLTERQREVLQLLAEGRTMREVATILNLSTRTVAFHKYRLMETLGVRTNSELVRFALEKHLLSL